MPCRGIKSEKRNKEKASGPAPPWENIGALLRLPSRWDVRKQVDSRREVINEVAGRPGIG